MSIRLLESYDKGTEGCTGGPGSGLMCRRIVRNCTSDAAGDKDDSPWGARRCLSVRWTISCWTIVNLVHKLDHL